MPAAAESVRRLASQRPTLSGHDGRAFSWLMRAELRLDEPAGMASFRAVIDLVLVLRYGVSPTVCGSTSCMNTSARA
jgi:hypothetical protein